MKKYLLFFVFSVFAMVSIAQTESPHLTFKGVPIDGTLDEYVQKMKQKGFNFLGIEDGRAYLKGDFASYRGCSIGVATLKEQDLVSKIVVIFPKCETWTWLSNNYYSLKEMLSEKYGQPADVVEKFDSYSEPRDDNMRMHEVGMDRCKYSSTFETPKGTIILRISHDSSISYYVVLSYIDKINDSAVRAKAIDDL